ncbi:Werner syndrome ATP-dependent helicase [Arachis hypogaea]|nr:Werner syndrome ATP-dependent helicase [Arachis hypogaea]
MDPNFKFVGVGIENDIKRLKSDYGLECKNGIDLATFAGEKCDQNYSSRGLKFLAKELVGLDMKKSKDICTSEWKSKELTKDQIEYACIDAYASYKIGHYLLLQKEEVYPKPI